jgi:uncharacterized YccA/Bax inhibitor family protein
MAELMRTANPALNEKTFREVTGRFEEPMTLSGTVNKTGILLLCAMAAAAWTWSRFMQTHTVESISLPMMAGFIGGFVMALVTSFKKEWSPVTAPIYAALEGLALGGFSAMLEMRFHGIAIQAVSLTFGTMLALLLAYRSGLIKVTQNFRLGIIAATGGIALFYLAQFVLGFFGVRFGTLNGAGPIGIAVSVVVVAIAALNLVLDFDFIESAVGAGAPKYMEWYGAFGLMVTLVWLYMEILRLLTKIRGRD